MPGCMGLLPLDKRFSVKAVAGSGAELYISGQSEGPATIPGNSSREKKK